LGSIRVCLKSHNIEYLISILCFVYIFRFVLKNSLCIDIKQRTGSIANLDNYEKLITNKLRYEKYLTWKINYNIIEKITNNINILIFIKKFLIQNNTNLVDNINIENLYENNFIQMLLIEFYNCLTKDKIHALPIYISMLMVIFLFLIILCYELNNISIFIYFYRHYNIYRKQIIQMIYGNLKS